jgi:hypothetical protein
LTFQPLTPILRQQIEETTAKVNRLREEWRAERTKLDKLLALDEVLTGLRESTDFILATDFWLNPSRPTTPSTRTSPAREPDDE